MHTVSPGNIHNVSEFSYPVIFRSQLILLPSNLSCQANFPSQRLSAPSRSSFPANFLSQRFFAPSNFPSQPFFLRSHPSLLAITRAQRFPHVHQEHQASCDWNPRPKVNRHSVFRTKLSVIAPRPPGFLQVVFVWQWSRRLSLVRKSRVSQ